MATDLLTMLSGAIEDPGARRAAEDHVKNANLAQLFLQSSPIRGNAAANILQARDAASSFQQGIRKSTNSGEFEAAAQMKSVLQEARKKGLDPSKDPKGFYSFMQSETAKYDKLMPVSMQFGEKVASINALETANSLEREKLGIQKEDSLTKRIEASIKGAEATIKNLTEQRKSLDSRIERKLKESQIATNEVDRQRLRAEVAALQTQNAALGAKLATEQRQREEALRGIGLDNDKKQKELEGVFPGQAEDIEAERAKAELDRAAAAYNNAKAEVERAKAARGGVDLPENPTSKSIALLKNEVDKGNYEGSQPFAEELATDATVRSTVTNKIASWDAAERTATEAIESVIGPAGGPPGTIGAVQEFLDVSGDLMSFLSNVSGGDQWTAMIKQQRAQLAEAIARGNQDKGATIRAKLAGQKVAVALSIAALARASLGGNLGGSDRATSAGALKEMTEAVGLDNLGWWKTASQETLQLTLNHVQRLARNYKEDVTHNYLHKVFGVYQVQYPGTTGAWDSENQGYLVSLNTGQKDEQGNPVKNHFYLRNYDAAPPIERNKR